LSSTNSDTVTAGLQRAPCARQDEVADVAIEPEVIEIATIETRQHGDAEHLQRITLVVRRRFHDRLVSMHGHETGAPVLELSYRGTYRCRDIEELEIAEDLPVAGEHPVEQLEIAAAHHQLEAELVEGDCIAELVRERHRRIAVGDVKGEYQPVSAGNVFRDHVSIQD
jgi:hypothetical protein